MIKGDSVKLPHRYLLTITTGVIIGTAIGGYFLKLVPNDDFESILACVLLFVGIWFFVDAKRKSNLESHEPAPEKASRADVAVSLITGFGSGFVGISAPILAAHYGSYLSKAEFRRLMVLAWIPGSISMVATYYLNDLITPEIVYMSGAAIPGLLVGLYLGNKVFLTLSQAHFRYLLGVLIIFIALLKML